MSSSYSEKFTATKQVLSDAIELGWTQAQTDLNTVQGQYEAVDNNTTSRSNSSTLQGSSDNTTSGHTHINYEAVDNNTTSRSNSSTLQGSSDNTTSDHTHINNDDEITLKKSDSVASSSTVEGQPEVVDNNTTGGSNSSTSHNLSVNMGSSDERISKKNDRISHGSRHGFYKPDNLNVGVEKEACPLGLAPTTSTTVSKKKYSSVFSSGSANTGDDNIARASEQTNCSRFMFDCMVSFFSDQRTAFLGMGLLALAIVVPSATVALGIGSTLLVGCLFATISQCCARRALVNQANGQEGMLLLDSENTQTATI